MTSRTSCRSPPHGGEHAKQHVDALAGDRAADVQQFRRPPGRAEQPRRFDVGRRFGRRRAARVRPVQHHAGPAGVDAAAGDESIARRFGITRDVTGAAQARQGSAASSPGT